MDILGRKVTVKANTIQRAPRDRGNPYRVINRHAMEDDRLTFEARGVLAYILVKPDDWEIQINDLRRSGNAGRDKIYRIINELIAFGYIIRESPRKPDGTIGKTVYNVYENPQVVESDAQGEPLPAEPLPEKPDTAEPDTAEPLPVNTDHNNKENTTNKERVTKKEQQQPDPARVPSPAQQPESDSRGRRFSDADFGEVCRAYESEIGTFTAMSAQELESLYDEHGKEWVIDAIRIAVTQNARRLSYVKSVLSNWKRDGRGGKPAKPATYANGHSKPAADPDLTFKQWCLKTYQTDIVAAITRGTNKAEKELRDEYDQWRQAGLGITPAPKRHPGQPGQ